MSQISMKLIARLPRAKEHNAFRWVRRPLKHLSRILPRNAASLSTKGAENLRDWAESLDA
jgi:hypothetical protein